MHVWPLFQVTPAGQLDKHDVRDHGPLLGARASWQPLSWLGLQLGGRGVPIVFGAASGDTRLAGRHLDVGAGVQFGNVPLGGLRVAGVLDYGYGLTKLSGGAVELKVNRQLILLGLR